MVKVHGDGVSIYVQNVDLYSLKHKYNCKGDVIQFENTEAYSNFDLTKIKYNAYKQSRNENLKVME
jgi:hypothetical protein